MNDDDVVAIAPSAIIAGLRSPATGMPGLCGTDEPGAPGVRFLKIHAASGLVVNQIVAAFADAARADEFVASLRGAAEGCTWSTPSGQLTLDQLLLDGCTPATDGQCVGARVNGVVRIYQYRDNEVSVLFYSGRDPKAVAQLLDRIGTR